MKKQIIILLFILSSFSIINPQESKDIIFQFSTIGALMEGIYDGNMTIKELKNHGNIGVGTFNNLDGEMIALDGKFYQIKSDGKINIVDDSQKTPFAVITFFNEDFSIAVNKADFNKLQKTVERNLPSRNLFYAVLITGKFSYIKTRSVPRQTKPYPKLVEVTKSQREFEFKNLKGTLVGFRIPNYANGINVGGFHFHFLSDDQTAGGHLLDCVLDEGNISIDQKLNVSIKLPSTAEFFNANFNTNLQQGIIKTEK